MALVGAVKRPTSNISTKLLKIKSRGKWFPSTPTATEPFSLIFFRLNSES
jgi:hypothetical protein